VASWSFLTSHGRALLCIARDPEVRLRDIADNLAITERRAYGIVTDLTEAGYVVKHKDGRRNRYQIQDHLPLPEFHRARAGHRRRAGSPRGYRRSALGGAQEPLSGARGLRPRLPVERTGSVRDHPVLWSRA